MYTMSDAHLGQWTPCTSYRLQKSARHCCKWVLRATTALCSSTLPRLFVTWASKMPLRRHSKTTMAVKAVCSVKIICIGCMRVCGCNSMCTSAWSCCSHEEYANFRRQCCRSLVMEGHRSKVLSHSCIAHVEQPEQHARLVLPRQPTVLPLWIGIGQAQMLTHPLHTFVIGSANGSTKNGAC